MQGFNSIKKKLNIGSSVKEPVTEYIPQSSDQEKPLYQQAEI